MSIALRESIQIRFRREARVGFDSRQRRIKLMATATIYLVTASMNGLVNDCSTFARVESPTLRERGYTTIIYVNAYDFSDRTEFSLIDGRPTSKRDLSGVTSRKVVNTVKHWSSQYCTNWNGYGDDPDSGCNPLQLYPLWSGGQ